MIPAACKGVVCMMGSCTEFASHKIGEENVWDPHTQPQAYEAFNIRHNHTTYICDKHFKMIMDRHTLDLKEDNRDFSDKDLNEVQKMLRKVIEVKKTVLEEKDLE